MQLDSSNSSNDNKPTKPMSLSEANKILHGGRKNTTEVITVEKPFRGATLKTIKQAVDRGDTEFTDQYGRLFIITYLEGESIFIKPLRGYSPCGRFSILRVRTETEGL